LIEEDEKAEFKLVSCIDHAKLSILTEEDIRYLNVDFSVDAVLVGFTMQFNYYMLTYSSTLIEKGSQFFGVTDEESWRIGARELPGTATFIAAIERVTEQQAKIIGRINHEAISLIVQANSLKQNKCLLIENKLETDILHGINTGVHTCLISQYGSPFKINKLNDVKKSEILPNYMCNEFSL
jgi:ribonucleotide monophosphatase NagD (HAD superfamily)